MSRDDAGFRDRVILLAAEAERHADAVLGEGFLEQRPVRVASVEARKLHLRPEGSDVPRHVGRAPGIARLALDLDHGHGGLGGDARDTAPDEPIQHHIPDDEDAAVGKAGEEVLGGQGRFRHGGG